MYDEQGNWTGSEEERIAYNEAMGYTSPVQAAMPDFYGDQGNVYEDVSRADVTRPNIMSSILGRGGELPGWYSGVGAYHPGYSATYTGQPTSEEERNFITEYFNRFGYRPSSEEAAKYMVSAYGLKGGMPAYGGLKLNEGFNVEDYFTENAPTYQSFKAPPKMTIEQVLGQRGITDIRGVYKTQSMDYMAQTYPDVQKNFDIAEEAVNMAKNAGKEPTQAQVYALAEATKDMDIYDEGIAKIESALSSGTPIEQLPFIGNLPIGQLYANYIGNEYPSQMGVARNEWQQASQRSQWPLWRTAGAMADTGGRPTPQQQAEDDYRPAYQSLSSSLRLDAKNQGWMQQNYSALISTWLAQGQGKPFIEWVRSYIGGEQREPIRRYAPPVFNR